MSFVPGLPHPPYGLLARYFPPLAEGVAAEYAGRYSQPGNVLFDPFGQSAQLALEAAITGQRILVVNLNPVARFALGLAFDPLPETTLRAALTRLGDQPKDGERLEVHLQDLFRTTCPDCGAAVQADYFEWDKEAGQPVSKVFYCSTDGAMLARPADEADTQAARRFPARSLNYHWALDRATPTGDPDREHSALALAAYTPRVLHALVLLLHKFEALGPAGDERRALEALLLAAFDEAASVWPPGHDPHSRPRTLHPPARFREFNPWRAMENAVGQLAGPAHPVALCPPKELFSGESGGCVTLIGGSAREAAGRLPPGRVALGLTALPRPNPAFWGFSALWAAWLWGRAEAAPIRAVVHHRRTDFDWHEQGLRQALQAVRPALAADARLVGLLPDAEAGLVEAALTAADGAGLALRLDESAYRSDPFELQAVWQAAAIEDEAAQPEAVPNRVRREAVEASRRALLARGEPARWPALAPGVWMHLAERGLLRAAVQAAPDRPLALVSQAVAAGHLGDPSLTRFNTEREAELPDGEWWLKANTDAAEPLADRVEREVWRLLAWGDRIDEPEVEAVVCQAAVGLAAAPERRLVRACLASYAEENEAGLWRVRPEDQPAARAADQAEIAEALAGLGQRLGYNTRLERDSGDEARRVEWRESDQLVYSFNVQATAALGGCLARPTSPAQERFVVIPGGRAGLAAYKLRRDPRLGQAAESGIWSLLKYRHVRRMAADQGIDRAAFAATLPLDPVVEKPAAQIPLL
jgi:hypothetical protein